ncbi:MAG: hypothetical protein RLZZ399_848 [Verrucomicrobiota bacterium]|jgi:hypothetical protein
MGTEAFYRALYLSRDLFRIRGCEDFFVFRISKIHWILAFIMPAR